MSYVGLNLIVFAKVLRDGRWSEEDAAVLVPGDIISIKLGDIIPADSRLLDGDPLKIDQVGILFWLLLLFPSHHFCSSARGTESTIVEFAVGSDW